jgi:hypothetical protein
MRFTGSPFWALTQAQAGMNGAQRTWGRQSLHETLGASKTVTLPS